MKNGVLLFVLLVGLGCQSAAQSSAAVLVEDFEDGNTQNLLGGYWYSYSDNADGGKSRLKEDSWESGFVKKGGYKSAGMLQVEILLNKGDYRWNPYYAFATMVNRTAALSPSSFAGISYWHKGVAHKVEIVTPEITDYDYFQQIVPASEEWKLVTIDFSTLTQEGWGKKTPLNLNNSIRIAFKCGEASGIFQLDEIRFVNQIHYTKKYDLEIQRAQIPAPVAIKGNVSSPLNDLSKKYLTKGMNLTGWGEAQKITSPHPKDWKYNEASVKLQAEQGMRGIRFPIDLDLYLVNRQQVLSGATKKIEVEPMLFTLLDSMNSWTKRYRLSYTIDFHAYDGTYNRASSTDPNYLNAMSALWRIVAQHFVTENRDDLFFELTNEPCLSLPEGELIDREDWRLLAQMMIDSIRTVDKTRPIIFGDTKWYSLDELVKSKPFSDKYVIYCFHMYDPFLFTHQGASWTNMGTTKNIPFPYSPERWATEFHTFGIEESAPNWIKNQARNYYKEGNKQFIKNRLAIAKNWAYDYQVPLICNEWGVYPNKANLEDMNAYFYTMGEIFTEMDISWQVWFGIFDSEHKLLPGMSEALDLKKK